MMKKSVITFAILTLFILFATSGKYNPAQSAVGSMAPNFALSNADTTLSLQQLRGNYVLVSFWDSAEPQSRIDNMRYEHTKANYIHIGINADRSQSILGELCHIDGIDATMQFHVGPESRILAEWKQTREQMHAFLIDPQGTIVAVNPSTDVLEAL